MLNRKSCRIKLSQKKKRFGTLISKNNNMGNHRKINKIIMSKLLLAIREHFHFARFSTFRVSSCSLYRDSRTFAPINMWWRNSHHTIAIIKYSSANQRPLFPSIFCFSFNLPSQSRDEIFVSVFNVYSTRFFLRPDCNVCKIFFRPEPFLANNHSAKYFQNLDCKLSSSLTSTSHV